MQPLWKTVQRQLKVLKIELSHDPAIPNPDVNSKKTKTLSQIYALQCSLDYLQQSKYGNNLSVHWWMNGLNKCDSHTQACIDNII